MATISVKRARKILGKSSDQYTDEQLKQIILATRKLASYCADEILDKQDEKRTN